MVDHGLPLFILMCYLTVHHGSFEAFYKVGRTIPLGLLFMIGKFS